MRPPRRAPLAALAVVVGLGGGAAHAAAADTVRLGESSDAEAVAATLVAGAGARSEGPWAEVAGGVERAAAGDGWRGTLRLAVDGDAIALTATIAYDRDVEVERELVQLVVDGPAEALGRDLALAPLSTPLRVDSGTPILVASPSLLLLGESGFVAARYAPSPPSRVAIDLVLDDAAAHPFAVYRRCHSRYHPEDERSLVRHARRTRRAGETVTARAILYRRAPAADEVGPLLVERWAAGARAAVVFTDHADRTDPRALSAVLHGTSNPSSPAFGRGGFLGHHVRLTKTFFARPGRGSLEDDAAARALAEELVAAGDEVGPHSITPRKDPPPVVAQGLADFTRLGAVTWIDHQPTTNCEAMSNGGARAGDPFRDVELLAKAGFRWVWAASDEGHAQGATLGNLFRPAQREAAEPPYYGLPFPVGGGAGPAPLRVMRALWFYDEPGRLARALSDEALAKLEAERGLFVGHTYLSASAESTRTARLRSRLLVRPDGAGALVIDPRFDEALARLERHVVDGRVASLTWRDAGDRLVALSQVVVRYRPDGAVSVENRGPTAIAGLTVAVAADGVSLAVEGAALAGTRSEPRRATAWFDLPPGRAVLVRARRSDGHALSLGGARPLLGAPRAAP